MSARLPRVHLRALLCGALAAAFIASTAGAATFVVNSTGDQPDDNTADNVCHTAVGTCTLRAAIQQANATAGADIIQFAITGAGVHTIQPASSLPSITDPITIDGYSQPGSSVNTLAVGDNAVLLIEIDGSLIGSFANGLTIFTNACTIKGLVINRFTNPGISIDATGGGASGGHSIQGNFIGTTPDGMSAAGNSGFGVFVRSPSNLIGGANPADRNVIAATGGSSNPFVSNLSFEADFGASIIGNVAQGNYIGTNAAGNAALSSANGAYGVVVHSGTAGQGGVILGGPIAGDGNVIAGNTFFGVEIMSGTCTVTTTNVFVTGNSIGVDAHGGPLGNGYGGVHLGCGARNNTIGGIGAAAANVIANNGGGSLTGGGVLVDGFQTVPNGNQILGNSIHSNTKLPGAAFQAGLGIDLNSDGPTPNDPGDGDTGPNNLQNYPVLTSVFVGPSSVAIQGTLNSSASTTFRVELFASTSCDPSGFGEGETFLGSTNVTTDGTGNGTFSVVLPVAVSAGASVTATATDSAANNTSEFSACFTAQAPLTFFTVPPCRIIDTRGPAGPYGAPALANAASRDFVLAGQCAIPPGARAASINIAVTGATNGPGFLTIYPGGVARPLASTMNYKAGQTRANNAIVTLGASGDVLVFVGQGGGTVQLILDVDGYFQ